MTRPFTEHDIDAAAGVTFAALLSATHLSRPSDLARLLAEKAAGMGVLDLVCYLVDYEQVALIPMQVPALPERPVQRIDGTLAGRAFAASTILETDAGRADHRRLWVPLIDGTDRIGVAEMVVPLTDGAVPPALYAYCERYVHLAAGQIVAKGAYGDAFEQVRRRRRMSVAAELQWALLPPLTFATRGLVLAGLLEPCYTAGGDTFDYAVNGSLAHLAVFDAMGHGLAAAGTAAMAVSAYRGARRELLDLVGTYAAIDATLRQEYHGDRFATAVLARLDLETGVLRWVNAGHPAPLLLRGGKLVKALDVRPGTPLGVPFGDSPVTVGEEALEPGDRVLFYTDGVTEARTADGTFFTAERLAEFLEREAAGGRATPETLRRLQHAFLAHQDGDLQDDATVLLVEWRRDTEYDLIPQTVEH